LTSLLDRAASARRLACLFRNDLAALRLEQLAEDLDAQIARYVRHELQGEVFTSAPVRLGDGTTPPG
jgi:hypothetical protein